MAWKKFYDPLALLWYLLAMLLLFLIAFGYYTLHTTHGSDNSVPDIISHTTHSSDNSVPDIIPLSMCTDGCEFYNVDNETIPPIEPSEMIQGNHNGSFSNFKIPEHSEFPNDTQGMPLPIKALDKTTPTIEQDTDFAGPYNNDSEHVLFADNEYLKHDLDVLFCDVSKLPKDTVTPIQAQPVPEPATVLLLGSGLVFLIGWRISRGNE